MKPRPVGSKQLPAPFLVWSSAFFSGPAVRTLLRSQPGKPSADIAAHNFKTRQVAVPQIEIHRPGSLHLLRALSFPSVLKFELAKEY